MLRSATRREGAVRARLRYGEDMARLATGDTAPSFELLDQDGTKVRLADYRGQKVLIYFYPEADTPGCTRQSCDLRDHRQELSGIGAAVVGISPDAPEKQLAFDRKYGLGFPLLADEAHAVAERYGTWVDRGKDGRSSMGILRSSFLIDEDGTVADAWYGVKPEDTVPNALAALKD
jgi:peroxiredoxin Q/BCP